MTREEKEAYVLEHFSFDYYEVISFTEAVLDYFINSLGGIKE